MSVDIDQLLFENSVLKQKLWASRKKNKSTSYFFLIDTKYKPKNSVDEKRVIDYCKEIMEGFIEAIYRNEIITFNLKGHGLTNEFIKDIKVKYVIEKGKGKLKKDGTRGNSGGTIHIHVYIIILHHTNITIHWDQLKDYFVPEIRHHIGTENPYVSRPHLIPLNRVEEYMEKDVECGVWTTVAKRN